eukprot:GHVQ01001750.1.p1 GENE.GHVQ01001750.1~~GHVQ01001750.1.p1  ORF type:complete len:468 (-),score=65.75 GHVQ01001750.1:179-1582(-)
MSSSVLSSIPSDCLFQILAFVEVDAHIRLQCVSKQYNALLNPRLVDRLRIYHCPWPPSLPEPTTPVCSNNINDILTEDSRIVCVTTAWKYGFAVLHAANFIVIDVSHFETSKESSHQRYMYLLNLDTSQMSDRIKCHMPYDAHSSIVDHPHHGHRDAPGAQWMILYDYYRHRSAVMSLYDPSELMALAEHTSAQLPQPYCKFPCQMLPKAAAAGRTLFVQRPVGGKCGKYCVAQLPDMLSTRQETNTDGSKNMFSLTELWSKPITDSEDFDCVITEGVCIVLDKCGETSVSIEALDVCNGKVQWKHEVSPSTLCTMDYDVPNMFVSTNYVWLRWGRMSDVDEARQANNKMVVDVYKISTGESCRKPFDMTFVWNPQTPFPLYHSWQIACTDESVFTFKSNELLLFVGDVYAKEITVYRQPSIEESGVWIVYRNKGKRSPAEVGFLELRHNNNCINNSTTTAAISNTR